MKSKKIYIFAILIIALLFNITVLNVFGDDVINQETSNNGDVKVENKMFGTTVLSGNNIEVNEDIDGTVIIFGNNVNLNGNINGDAIVFSYSLNVLKEIDGNLYSFSNTLNMTGNIKRDAFLFSQNANLNQSSKIERDVMIFNAKNDLLGLIGRNAYVASGSTNILGEIGGNVKVDGNLNVNDSAVINGSLTQENNIKGNISDGAKIAGSYKFVESKGTIETKPTFGQKVMSATKSIIYSTIVGIVIWLIATFIFKGFSRKSINIFNKPLSLIGFGAMTLILTPIISILLMITVIGLPIGVIALLVYGIMIYLSKYLVAIAISNYIQQKYNLKQVHNNFWYFLFTIIIINILFKIPYLGIVLGIISLCLTFGLFFIKNKNGEVNGTTSLENI